MWPYDYFNEYSGLYNEFLTDSEALDKKKKDKKRKKVFVAMWYADREKKVIKRNQGKKREFIKNVLNGIPALIFSSERNREYINPLLHYKFRSILADEDKKGEKIDTNILCNIIESILVICEITPMDYGFLKKGKGKNKNNDNIKPNFNSNVMYELGLAVAWKMPEQVIILCDENKKESIIKWLPTDLKNFKVLGIDLENKKQLENIIKTRISKLDLKKHTIIKSIKTKLDHCSLSILERRNGLMFPPDYTSKDSFHYHCEVDTIRHLLNLGIFRTEKFPDFTYGYCLTDLGRVVLHQLGVKLYPRIFSEMLRVSFWRRDSKNNKFDREKFKEQQKEFRLEYNVSWSKCEKFLKYWLHKKGESRDDQVITMFNRYCNGKTFNFIRREVVFHWEREVDKEIKSRSN